MLDSDLCIPPIASRDDRPSTQGLDSRQQFLPLLPQSLDFDWHKLTALGVAPEEAKAIAHTLEIKKTMLRYWRKLVQAGVPLDDARRVSRAIAKYDVAGVLPTLQQQALVRQYCPMVCRTGLWRVELLLTARS